MQEEQQSWKEPVEQKPRWMNDTDMNTELVPCASFYEGDVATLLFRTPIGEHIRRTVKMDKPEYAAVRTAAMSGKKAIYHKTNGFRVLKGTV